ncbi:MAG: diacylglycerol/lipid kinase family protein [Chloroflexota bacterium]
MGDSDSPTRHARVGLGGVLQRRRRFFVIVNKQSGNYLRWLVQLRIGEFLTTEGVSGDIHYLTDVETLKHRLEQAYSEGFRTFVVAGGDGTVSLLASLLQGKDCSIGIVPIGTTNMLAQLLGVPLGARKSLEMLLNSDCTRRIDALAVKDRLFFLNASAGLSSFSISDLRTTEKSYFKLLAYVFAVSRSMRKARTRRFTLTFDGQSQVVEAAELFVDNAGAIWMPRYRTSDALIDDGLAEICYVQKGSPVELANAILDVVLVRKKRQTIRHIASARSIVIDCEESMPVQADGDSVTTTPATITVVPEAAKFVIPRS